MRLHGAFPEVRQFPFLQGYAVGSTDDEVARVRCELSRARLELMAWNRTCRATGRLTPGLGQPPDASPVDPGMVKPPPLNIDPGMRTGPPGIDPMDFLKYKAIGLA